MTPVDTLGEPVTVVDTLGEPVVLINNDGTPAFLAYSAKTYLGGVAPYHWLDFVNNRALYASVDVGDVTQATGYSFTRASQGYYQNADGTLTLFGYNLLTWSEDFSNAAWTKSNTTAGVDTITASSTGASREVNRGFTSTSGTAYTFSLELKQGNTAQSEFAIIDQGVAVYRGRLTYATGAVTAVSGSPALTVLALSGGWFRVSISVTIPSGGSDSIHITPNTDASSTAGDFCYVRNAQLEPSASLGSYVPTTTSAAGALRRGDRGVLIEGSRTNVARWSEDISNAAWNKLSGGTATSANTFDFTSTSGSGFETSLDLTASAGTAVTASAWFSGSGEIRISVLDASGSFAGTHQSITLTSTPTRVSVTRTLVDANALLRVSNVSGSAVTGAKIERLQLEAGAFPSSYIPTVAASATRAADVLTYTVNGTAELAAIAATQPELVTNPGPFTNTTGWTVSGGTLSVVDGSLVVTSTGAGTVYITQNFTSVVGQSYYCSASTTGSGIAINTYRIGPFTNFMFTIPVNGSVLGQSTDTDTTSAVTMFMTAAGAGETWRLNSISIKPIPAGTAAIYPLSLWAEFERAVDTGGTEVIAQVDNGSNNDSVNLCVNSTGTFRTFVTTGGAVQADQQSGATIAVNATTKAALRVATNDTKNALNGTLTTADTSVTLPATPTLLLIGRSDLPPFGYIRRLAIIQGAGTDANLTAMTS
jgi:hypothetical protein